MGEMMHIILLSAAVACVSATVSKSEIFKPMRGRGPAWLQYLMQCPWCLNHWGAAIAVAISDPAGVREWAIATLAVVTFATILSGLKMRLLFIPEAEKAQLKQLLKEKK